MPGLASRQRRSLSASVWEVRKRRMRSSLLLHLLLRRGRAFSSAASSAGSFYSFLQPSIFSHKKPQPQRVPDPISGGTHHHQQQRPNALTSELKTSIETSLHKAVLANDTDQAWKSFKTLTSYCDFPSKSVTNGLIAHLASLGDTLNLKRAFASVVYLIEKKPNLVDFHSVVALLESMKCADTPAPAFALIKSLLKNRFFVPFGLWGNVLAEISRSSGHSILFLRVFEEVCRIALDEKLDYMKPDLVACNAALEACCRCLESVTDAEKVVETMSVLGIRPDELCLGSLGYLYALKGLEEKISELENLMDGFGLTDKRVFYIRLIDGYVKISNFKSVTETILRCQREYADVNFGEETYREVLKGFLNTGSIKELATLITESQKLETAVPAVDRSIGYGLINACIGLGQSDKAHNILDEINILGGSVGLGVYLPILKAYSKQQRTAEATQLVMDISNSGLQLDSRSYDSLIEASMSCQDFQSAFTLFRDMRDARVEDLKGSYLTIMTGLMENHRPELMAAFLDEVVEDPRIEVGTHDWNSIIHAFCKAGRLEDARRTFRRMVFLQFEPNGQTYLSLINGYVTAEKYFSVLMLWNEVKRKLSAETGKGLKLDHTLVDAFLYALVKGGFFDAVMQVVEKAQEMKVFVDKWRYKQAFMETHKKLRVNKLRKRNTRKMEALVSFKNWAGLNG